MTHSTRFKIASELAQAADILYRNSLITESQAEQIAAGKTLGSTATNDYCPTFFFFPDVGEGWSIFGWQGDGLAPTVANCGAESVAWIKSKPRYNAMAYLRDIGASCLCVRREPSDRDMPRPPAKATNIVHPSPEPVKVVEPAGGQHGPSMGKGKAKAKTAPVDEPVNPIEKPLEDDGSCPF